MAEDMSFDTFHTGTNWESDADFSQVARIPADADIVVTSGQVAYDADGNVVGPSDVSAQIEQCFENLGRTLEAADASFDDVVKLRYSVTEPEHYEPIKELRPEYLSEPYPTGMLGVVDELAEPELMVEIEAIAAVR